MEELRAETQYQLAVRAFGVPGTDSQKIVNSLSEASTGACRGKPCPRALPNQVALKLRQGGEDVEDEPSGWGVRLDAFREGNEPDSPALQIAHYPNQVRQRPAEAVKPPDHQDIPRAQRLEAAFELRPCGRLPGGMLLVDERAAVATEGIELQIQILIVG
jgi:hypothetical protein